MVIGDAEYIHTVMQVGDLAGQHNATAKFRLHGDAGVLLFKQHIQLPEWYRQRAGAIDSQNR